MDDNQILSELPQAEETAIRSHLTLAALTRDKVLARCGDALTRVYFPTTALISMRTEVEIGLIGAEGVVGGFCALGRREAPHELRVVSGGSAYSMECRAFAEALEELPVLRARVLEHLHRQLSELSEAAHIHASGSLAERLAWRLDARFARGNDELRITHAELSNLLGVRRAGITLALHAFEARRAIRSGRGRITLLDRGALIDRGAAQLSAG